MFCRAPCANELCFAGTSVSLSVALTLFTFGEEVRAELRSSASALHKSFHAEGKHWFTHEVRARASL
jgi:hypothetical protein